MHPNVCAYNEIAQPYNEKSTLDDVMVQWSTY